MLVNSDLDIPRTHCGLSFTALLCLQIYHFNFAFMHKKCLCCKTSLALTKQRKVYPKRVRAKGRHGDRHTHVLNIEIIYYMLHSMDWTWSFCICPFHDSSTIQCTHVCLGYSILFYSMNVFPCLNSMHHVKWIIIMYLITPKLIWIL